MLSSQLLRCLKPIESSIIFEIGKGGSVRERCNTSLHKPYFLRKEAKSPPPSPPPRLQPYIIQLVCIAIKNCFSNVLIMSANVLFWQTTEFSISQLGAWDGLNMPISKRLQRHTKDIKNLSSGLVLA